MKRWIIDTNFLGNDEFEAYLSAEPTNFGLLPQIALIEIHKSEAVRTARIALKIACRFPKQIVILKDMSDLVYMPPTASPVWDLVDHALTESFDQYCDTMINGPLDDAVLARFDLHERESREVVEELGSTAHRIYNLFKIADGKFGARDIDQLCKRKIFSPELQVKLVEFGFAIRDLFIARSAEPEDSFPQTRTGIINTYLFRYSLAIALYYARWVRAGKVDMTNAKRLVNRMHDMKIAAIATFFDGVMTKDEGLQEAYDDLLPAITALGGVVSCGSD